MARRRRLSPEEQALWERVAGTAEPLTETPVAVPAKSPVRAALSTTAASRALVPSTPLRRADVPRIAFDLAPDPSVAPERPHPHMDRRRFEKLRRGRIVPEARLDLHGMTRDAAHGALIAFMLDAHARGLRLVLVITGKGRPGRAEELAPHRHGILRHAVPHWLAAPPLNARVLQVAPAHARHGGGGALYVYLRRLR
jgi:DNA-nicking Smr family endonuclease